MKESNNNYIEKFERQAYEVLIDKFNKYDTKYGCLTQKKYLDYFTNTSSKFIECEKSIHGDRYTDIM